MTESPRSSSSRWLSYAVAGGLGTAFWLVLVVNAWYTALQNAEREFSFVELPMRNATLRNVRDTEDIAGGIAAVFEATGRIDAPGFERYTRRLIARRPFVVAVSYHPWDPQYTSDPASVRALNPGTLPPVYVVAPAGNGPVAGPADLAATPALRAALATAIEGGTSMPILAPADGSLAGTYLLLKPVLAPVGTRGQEQLTGIIAVVISPQRLVGPQAFRSPVAVTLVLDSQGVSGRQVVYDLQPATAGGGIELTRFAQESLTQYPLYSVRLSIHKPVYLADLDLGVVLIAFVLGGGTTMLMVALAHAKETQARALLARNAEIERQVQWQTRELAETRDQALKASRVKSEFLASMSHEIRTPLNAIIGMAELLSETPLDVDQEKYVSVFRKAGEALLSLVNDILDLSKIEAGQLVLERINFELREVVESSVDIYALKCDEKGIELACHIDEDVPRFLLGDPGRLRQVLLNLVGNAIKFTERGEIVVHVVRDRDHPGPGQLRFSVSDTGIGIPADKRQSIFQSFTQVDSSTTRKYGGTGLGLTISQKLVEKMNGRIWVDSELGTGSTFHFAVEFGLGEEVQSVQRVVAPVALRGTRVLVIDDNATNRLILEEALRSQGADVCSARDGREGLEAYRRARADGREFRLILTDCRMPGMDGFEVTEAIKAEGGAVGTIMMLTSASLGPDIERARRLGMGGYLVKPIKRNDLFQAIARLFASRPEGAPERIAAPSGEQPAAYGGAILLVEDTPDNRLLITAYLKNEPYRVDEADNGELAVEMFKAGDYGLVLMDVQMPVMDGHEATRRIRAWEAAQGRAPTPVVALTAHALKEEMDKSLAAGCTAHLTKPIKKATLLASVRHYLG
ncbi:MAG: response regulator [Gammaproteobacteria bacterium]|nr:response regulator [Gammaproteobacteria bacterium]